MSGLTTDWRADRRQRNTLDSINVNRMYAVAAALPVGACGRPRLDLPPVTQNVRYGVLAAMPISAARVPHAQSYISVCRSDVSDLLTGAAQPRGRIHRLRPAFLSLPRVAAANSGGH